MGTLIKINRSAREMQRHHIPSVTHINNFESSWQQSVFHMRSYAQHKNKEYYAIAVDYQAKTLLYIDSLKANTTGQHKIQLNMIETSLNTYLVNTKRIEQSIASIESNYLRLDSAIADLQDYSSNYLSLQYKKLKADVDKKAADDIIKRRVDKVDLMSQIVSVTEQIKATIGEANFRQDYQLLEHLPASLQKVHSNVARIRPITTKQYDLEALDAIDTLSVACKEAVSDLIISYNENSRLTNHDKTTKDLLLVRDLATKIEEMVKHEAASYQEQTQSAQLIWWIFLLITLVLAITLSMFISSSLSKPIQRLTQISAFQEKGYFPVFDRLARKDEIGLLTNVMQSGQQKTKSLVENLQNIASSIDMLINQLHQKSITLSHASNTQSVSTEEISASMDEVAHIAITNSSKSSDAVKEIQKAATIISTHLEQTTQSMDTMEQLMNSSDSISYLASKTYILSLNASVEAARSSNENAKGFSVIARNMRELAEQVKDTSDKMSAITKKGREASSSTLSNIGFVDRVMTQSIQTLQEFDNNAHEQNNEISQINQTVQGLNNYSQQNTQLSEELAAESSQLGKLSQQLHKLLEFYQIKESVLLDEPSMQRLN